MNWKDHVGASISSDERGMRTFLMFSANLSYSSRTSCSSGVRSSFGSAGGVIDCSEASILEKYVKDKARLYNDLLCVLISTASTPK